MLKELQRKYSKQNGGTKYHIKCDALEKTPSSIEIEKVAKNSNDISILIGILKNQEIINKHKHIVVKIGNPLKTIEKEWNIGIKLNNLKIEGFIKYDCLFRCHDDTYSKYKSRKIIKNICSADNKNENEKIVLVMPYISEGSIKNFNWTVDKFDILRSVIIQSIFSSFIAYHLTGFIHGDFHLDNILMKKTKQTTVNYTFGDKIITVPTNGYKIMILDYDSSWINLDKNDGLTFYWLNLFNMLSRINMDLKNKDGDRVDMLDNIKILDYINLQKTINGDYINTSNLIKIINHSPITLIKNPMKNLKYEHNVY